MLIVGYCFGITSERRLCNEVQVNPAHRCLRRLGLDDNVPAHSTFNRHGHFRDSDLLRHVFGTVVRRELAKLKLCHPGCDISRESKLSALGH